MAENDNKTKREQVAEPDPFLNFMFGNNIIRKDGTQSEREQTTSERGQHWSDDWFWGNRRNIGREARTSGNEIENILNQVDIELLMETIDMFVLTTKQLKPLLKELRPYLSLFSKKTEPDKT